MLHVHIDVIGTGYGKPDELGGGFTVWIPLILRIPRPGENRNVRLTEEREEGENEQMPTAETQVTLSEQELVERWRAKELERAGYPAEAAEELAMRGDVDLHRAAQLLGQGCSPELALKILL